MNFMLYNSLGGGGIASLRSDPQVQFYSQYNCAPNFEKVEGSCCFGLVRPCVRPSVPYKFKIGF